MLNGPLSLAVWGFTLPTPAWRTVSSISLAGLEVGYYLTHTRRALFKTKSEVLDLIPSLHSDWNSHMYFKKDCWLLTNTATATLQVRTSVLRSNRQVPMHALPHTHVLRTCTMPALVQALLLPFPRPLLSLPTSPLHDASLLTQAGYCSMPLFQIVREYARTWRQFPRYIPCDNGLSRCALGISTHPASGFCCTSYL